MYLDWLQNPFPPLNKELDSRVDIQEAEKHLRSEIESFEKLQSKIVAIEENLRKAADSSYVDEQKLMEINSLLLDIDKKVVKPLTDKLMNYQTNLGYILLAPKHKDNFD